MTQFSPEHTIQPAAPSEVGPDWQNLEIVPGPTVPAEQIAYLEGYTEGQKAATYMVAAAMGEHQVTSIAETEEQKSRARTDELTGLPNRRGLIHKIDGLIATRPGDFGVLFVDIDGLKQTNDNQGHKAGDQLIIRGADALADGLGSNHTHGHMAARQSGDELVGIVENVADEDELEQVAIGVRDSFDEAGIPASLGVALHRTGETATDVIGRADSAMYEIKNVRKEIQEEQRQDAERAALPEDRRDFYDGIYEDLWHYPGGSPQEFRNIYFPRGARD